MSIDTKYKHIIRENVASEPYVEGTRLTVSFIVNELGNRKNLNGVVDALISAYPPGYLSREKVLSAIEYYKENTEEIEKYIAESKIRTGRVLKTR